MGQDHFPSSLTKNDAYFCISKVPDIHVLMNLFFPAGIHYSVTFAFLLITESYRKAKV